MLCKCLLQMKYLTRLFSASKQSTRRYVSFWENRYCSKKNWIVSMLENQSQATLPDEFLRTKLNAAVSTRRSHESGDLIPYYFAKDLMAYYNSKTLDDNQKAKLFQLLYDNFSADAGHVNKSMLKLQASLENNRRSIDYHQFELSQSLIPTYQHLFADVGKLEGGCAFLVNMRKDLLSLFRSGKLRRSVASLSFDRCLKKQLADWFAGGFLDLQPITWENTPASIIEKMISYEAVHPIDSWAEMKKRLGCRRKVFVFTHRLMPGEPCVILHTLLGNDRPSNIYDVLATKNEVSRKEDVETVTFYSITSTQRGLDGIGLGDMLIKKVVEELRTEYPCLNTFITLSPIPKFAKWLDYQLKVIAKEGRLPKSFEGFDLSTCYRIKSLLARKEWHLNEQIQNELKTSLSRLCFRYLVSEKRRGFALDPVAHFHLRNGASLWRLNWLGNANERGLRTSYGMMANYVYKLDEIERNNYLYLSDGNICTSQLLEEMK